MENSRTRIRRIMEEVGKAVIGKDRIIEKVLTALLAKGHILIEDIPGVGKTTLALSFSKVMDLEEHRMQFTPDVLPTDVVGFTILNQNQEFEYKPGAVLCNLFLADEINRTSSKTQSALLEVMEEGRITVDGVTRPVPEPFMVIATQNPVGSIGTTMLPESQLDRFMIKLSMGYPDVMNEVNILKGRQNSNPVEELQTIITREEILAVQSEVENIYIHDRILQYIAELSASSRSHQLVELGISPRGTIAVTGMAKAHAYMQGREYMIPQDVMAVFPDVAGHRLVLSAKARVNHVTVQKVIEDILESVAAPRVKAE